MDGSQLYLENPDGSWPVADPKLDHPPTPTGCQYQTHLKDPELNYTPTPTGRQYQTNLKLAYPGCQYRTRALPVFSANQQYPTEPPYSNPTHLIQPHPNLAANQHSLVPALPHHLGMLPGTIIQPPSHFPVARQPRGVPELEPVLAASCTQTQEVSIDSAAPTTIPMSLMTSTWGSQSLLKPAYRAWFSPRPLMYTPQPPQLPGLLLSRPWSRLGGSESLDAHLRKWVGLQTRRPQFVQAKNRRRPSRPKIRL